MRINVSVYVCLVAIVLILPFWGTTAYGERINPETDLVYLGAFRLPSDTTGSNYGWGYGLEAMTYYPKGDPNGPSDGYPGSLFATNHTYEKYVAEISIPVPIKSKNLNELNRATTLQNFHDINRGTYSTSYMEMEICYLPKQGDQTSDKLYISWNSWYNTSDNDVDRYAWSELNLSNPNTQGPWNLGHGEVNIGTVGEYLFEIPQSWAALHTPGKLLVAGKYREGGCSGGGYRYGGGPGLHAFGPWKQGNPPTPGTELDQVTLLSYAGGHVWQCPANGDSCKVGDKWEGGAWITAGSKSAVVLVGRKGFGEDRYGEHCAGKGYYNTGGYKPYMLFYDPDDLADVADGNKQPYEPQPYATLDCGKYAFKPFDQCKDAGFSSAAYDRQHQLLYVAEPRVDGSKAVIHVFRIVDRSGGLDTSPPGRSSGEPSGELSARTTQTTISLNTDEPAICKYSTSQGVEYDAMSDSFGTAYSTEHSTTLTGLTSGHLYNIYVRCMDQAGNINTDDYLISFSVGSNNDSSSIIVSSVSELEDAISHLHSNTKIILQPGIYSLNNSLVIQNGVVNVTIAGSTDDRDAVVIKGHGMSNSNYGNAGFGIVIANAQNVTIQDLTIEDFYFHDIMIKSEEGAKRPVLRNLHLKDAGEQLIKVSAAPNQGSYCDGGVVENCLIEYTDRARIWYTNGLDVMAAKDWIVRNNTFRNIRAPEGQIAGPTILFWQNSINTIIEKNRIINCDIGIAFGNSSGPGQYARDGETTYDHQGGIIRNNFIYRSQNQSGDVGISVNKAKNFKILNNTVILNGTFPWAIEYRFSSSSGMVANNLTDGPIQARDGAQASLVTNVTNAQPSWFQGFSTGNLHLASQATAAIDHATVYSDVLDDIDSEIRGSTPDIGADEYQSSASGISPPATLTAQAANSIDLFWSSVSGATGYNVYRSTTSGSGYVKINNKLVTGTSYVDQKTTPGTTYYYVVTSVDAEGHESKYSLEAYATEPTGNSPPSISSFSAEPNPAGNPKTSITFTVQASDPDGDALTYTMDFGDGTSSSSGSTATHAYTRKGTYKVEAVVSDGHGHTVRKTIQIIVDDKAPDKAKIIQVKK